MISYGTQYNQVAGNEIKKCKIWRKDESKISPFKLLFPITNKSVIVERRILEKSISMYADITIFLQNLQRLYDLKKAPSHFIQAWDWRKRKYLRHGYILFYSFFFLFFFFCSFFIFVFFMFLSCNCYFFSNEIASIHHLQTVSS